MEDLQKQWTTYRNLILWLDTWDKDHVKPGFSYRDDEEKYLFLKTSLE